jgi:penicillin G amidase
VKNSGLLCLAGVLLAAGFALGSWHPALALQQSQGDGRTSKLHSMARSALSQIDGEVAVPGLRGRASVVRDEWGVPHITAESEEDLFFAQGYVAAQDRLWQMEIWRRTGEGRLAEVLGPDAVGRDRVARLLKYRGPIDDRELESYHPRGRQILSAFVAGVNAYITTHADRLPIEFVLTGIRPDPWALETVTLRQVTFGDAASELQLARSVAQLGAVEANRRRNPDPWDDLRVPDGLDVATIGDEVLAATRPQGRIPDPAILPEYRSLVIGTAGAMDDGAVKEPGSNNWVVSGGMSATGKPVVANDPHREVTLPSLRYIFHLTAPGWNVVGASEPPFVGVAVGHNDRVAWGLTIVGTDQHDVYVEDLKPDDPAKVRWQQDWEPMQIVREEIKVKGGPSQTVELKFTRHGPVFHVDAARHRAYALRSALLEPGTGAYLGGLRLDQTKDCRQFLAEAMFWKSPSENLICGDVDGNISWQASALTPAREGWVGRLPVPGHGKYEWRGFRADLPRDLNPARGFIATANHNIQPKAYTPPLMFKNADARFERITRLLQMIKPGARYSLEDHQRMQHDALSLRAQADRPLFTGWTAAAPEVERARAMLAEWDGVYRRDSAAAALYETWRQASGRADGQGSTDDAGRRTRIEDALKTAVDRLTAAQGADWSQWRWGRMHTRAFPHPFVKDFDLPTVERAGGAGTVAADGATYREILDVSDWDRSLGINTPGQSGQPDSPYYGNLLPLWTDNKYFPLVFSAGAVKAHAKHQLTLKPR